MLTSLNRMVGLPVVLGDERVGCVERAALTPDARKLDGVVVRRGLGGARWVAADAVEMVGESCVVIRRKPARAASLPKEKSLVALSTSGKRVGEVTDALVCGDTLRLLALEVSAGPLYRLMGGVAYAVGCRARQDGRAVIVPRLMTWAELQRTLGEGDDG